MSVGKPTSPQYPHRLQGHQVQCFSQCSLDSVFDASGYACMARAEHRRAVVSTMQALAIHAGAKLTSTIGHTCRKGVPTGLQGCVCARDEPACKAYKHSVMPFRRQPFCRFKRYCLPGSRCLILTRTAAFVVNYSGVSQSCGRKRSTTP